MTVIRLLRRTAPTATILALPLLFAGPSLAEDQGSENGESRYLDNVRRLTYEGRRAGEGYYSADGTKMVLQSEREEGNPFYQIYLLDLETGDTARVSPGQGKTTCAFIRPDSTEVMYGSTHHDP